jgi:OOP family OmpA-OmpF porin
MKKGIIWCCLMLILFSKASAQISSNAYDTASEWYVGFCGEIPMGVSTFSSYGADKTRIGVGAGVYGGYRFNSVFSMEASALWCGMGMSAQKCCIDRGYWLGNDGIRYNVPVAGMQGCSYADVKSKVCLQQYGIHLNVNLLPFFYPVANHRWSISLSPVLYMMASQATLKNKVTDENVFRNGKQLNFGFGRRYVGGI